MTTPRLQDLETSFKPRNRKPGHGPRSVFVVSSKGLTAAGIGDSNIAVYRAVGEALSGWATDSQVQTTIQAYFIGNKRNGLEGTMAVIRSVCRSLVLCHRSARLW